MDPKLYIIMRKDIQDMNPGKAMAQAAHAQSDFDQWVEGVFTQRSQFKDLVNDINTWRDGRSFGVTLVLHEPLETINQIVNNTDYSGRTTDPTYPWRNYYGDVFTSSEITCAWVFLCSQSNPVEEEYMRQFGLHR